MRGGNLDGKKNYKHNKGSYLFNETRYVYYKFYIKKVMKSMVNA